MKKNLFTTLCTCCLLLYSTACSSGKKENVKVTEKSTETVELTPEFILAVQRYDVLGEFSEGLAPVGKLNENDILYGYINTKGEEVIPCNIEAIHVGCFSEGLACIVKEKNEKSYYSFIDRQGKTVITIDTPGAEYCEEESCYDRITRDILPCFKGGECELRFFDNDKTFYINKEGFVLREGVKEERYLKLDRGKYDVFSEGENYSYNTTGLKDENGNIVIPAKYNEIIGDGECGVFLATLADDGGEDGMMPEWFCGYVDLKGHDTFPETFKNMLQRQEKMKEERSPASFAKTLQNAKWIENKNGFKYPDFMYESKGVVFDNGNGSELYADTYTWEDIQLCSFWGQSWLAFEYDEGNFPIKGSVIGPNATIREVTYTSGNHSVFSGYLNDGRIFYLKVRLSPPSYSVIHAFVLTLIYPERFQKEVEPLMEIVRNCK